MNFQVRNPIVSTVLFIEGCMWVDFSFFQAFFCIIDRYHQRRSNSSNESAFRQQGARQQRMACSSTQRPIRHVAPPTIPQSMMMNYIHCSAGLMPPHCTVWFQGLDILRTSILAALPSCALFGGTYNIELPMWDIFPLSALYLHGFQVFFDWNRRVRQLTWIATA